MANTEWIIEVLNQVERNAGAIVVREQINGEWGNFTLLDLPTHLAIQHTCRIVRAIVRQTTGYDMRRRTVNHIGR